jgi:hypothetical protein
MFWFLVAFDVFNLKTNKELIISTRGYVPMGLITHFWADSFICSRGIRKNPNYCSKIFKKLNDANPNDVAKQDFKNSADFFRRFVK